MRETKTFPFKMSAVEESGEFFGYASTFGNVDLGGDVIDRGAFKKTLNDSGGKLPLLDHHDPTRQIGWNLEAREDARGLFVRGRLNLEVQAAREKHALMRQATAIGARMGLSIGFRTVRDERDREDTRVRRLKEIHLMEYSVVTFPMNPQAGVTAVKAKRDLLELFLGTEMGLAPQQAREAADRIKSLLTCGGADAWDPPEPNLVHSLEHLLHNLRMN